MPARDSSYERGIIYTSRGHWKLRLVTLLCWVPPALGIVLLRFAPQSEWQGTPLGGPAWWILPVVLAVLTLLLPAALISIHGRYVTRVVLRPDGQLRVTTFLVWGQRTEKLGAEQIARRPFRLDRAGDAPLGFQTLGTLGFRQPE